MSFNPLAGKNASVMVGSVAYAFDSWSLPMTNKTAEVSNFTGEGYEQHIQGLTGATVELSGPYDEGNMPFTLGSGTNYVLILGYTNMISLTVTAVLKAITPDVKVSDAIRIKLSFVVTGQFTAAIT